MLLILSLVWSTLCFAENLWATGPTTGTRWPDAAVTSVTLAKDDEVEVLVKDGDKVRVRKGTDFGWIASTALTDVAPPKADSTGFDLSSLGLPPLDALPEAPGQ